MCRPVHLACPQSRYGQSAREQRHRAQIPKIHSVSTDPPHAHNSSDPTAIQQRQQATRPNSHAVLSLSSFVCVYPCLQRARGQAHSRSVDQRRSSGRHVPQSIRARWSSEQQCQARRTIKRTRKRRKASRQQIKTCLRTPLVYRDAQRIAGAFLFPFCLTLPLPRLGLLVCAVRWSG